MAAMYPGALGSASQVGASDSSCVVSLDSSAMTLADRPAADSAEPTASITPARSEAGTSIPSWVQPLKSLSGSFIGLIWSISTPSAAK